MKFMKLGSKPDSFQADGDNTKYVATELATDVAVIVGDVKFYLHKFPLLSKSARLQKLMATSNQESNTGDEIHIPDIPGGPTAFEICAKFCYGITVTLNAYNVVSARSAAEYLEMCETVEKGNLVYKIEVFLNSSIFRSWKDSIIVLQTTQSLLPWSTELKLVSRCLDSIASKVSVDTARIEWSYTYNRKKLPSEDCVRMPQSVPKDWWVEDLCDLHIDIYKQVITTIKTKGGISSEIIGEALNLYAMKKIPGFNKGMIQSSDFLKYQSLLETIIWLLPTGKQSVSCSFLIKLLRAAIRLDCGEKERSELTRRIGQQLKNAKVGDLLIRAPDGGMTLYDVDIVQSIVEEFVTQEHKKAQLHCSEKGFEESNAIELASDSSEVIVAKLIDGYLAEIARDPNLLVSKFLGLADMVSSLPRQSHDGVYRAIDMFLKEHPEITKSERKRICQLMDCRKLSPEASTHAIQNERLPLRVVVQVLFFEQIQATTTSAVCTPPALSELPGLHGPVKALLPASGSHGSSRSTTTNTEEDWDSVPTAEDIKGLKGEAGSEKAAFGTVKGLVMSKIFSRLWSGKDKNGEISSSDTSESPGSASAEDKSTSSTCRRRSVS